MVAVSTADSLDTLEKARVILLGAGFLPWAFACSITRVLYGIETLMDR